MKIKGLAQRRIEAGTERLVAGVLWDNFRGMVGLPSDGASAESFWMIMAEGRLNSRRFVVLCAALAVLMVGLVGFGWLGWGGGPSVERNGSAADAVHVIKQPVNFANRTFDPAAPPSEMPPFSPGEAAVCDSNFISSVVVGGDGRKTDATHEIVTITKVTVTLQLNINVWAPGSATDHVMEHEDGHRQISEYYYATADKLAARIAATFIGKKELVNGTDLNAEVNKLLQQMGAEITDEYDKELNPEATQLRYDSITDHSRNDVAAKDAVAEVLKGVVVAQN